MPDPRLAAKRVPPGRWGIAVSGGADSVALLEWLRERDDVHLHVIHLDHQTRAGRSTEDAAFVAEWAKSNHLAFSVAARTEIESSMTHLAANRSERFRQARLALFRRTIADERLLGVILAHHADDQAETIIQRLLRGSGCAGLRGMPPDHYVSDVRLLRPMLDVRRRVLRAILHEKNIAWREDSSNSSMTQQRNRVRVMLDSHPELFEAAMQLSLDCSTLANWLLHAAPVFDKRFSIERLSNLPRPLAIESARRWLIDRAGAGVEISPRAAQRLVAMAEDAATPRRQHFPGGLLVARRGGFIEPG